MNFAGPARQPGERKPTIDFNARMVRATLLDQTGAAIENLEQPNPVRIDVILESARVLEPFFDFYVRNNHAVTISIIVNDSVIESAIEDALPKATYHRNLRARTNDALFWTQAITSASRRKCDPRSTEWGSAS